MRAGRLEIACWVAGATMMAVYGITRADAELGRRLELARFEQSIAPDQTAWSQSRVRAYRESLEEKAGPLLGSVTVPSVQLEVPLFGDTSELHLNRGAGVIEGTAAPVGRGNLGIAGHRDGFFRVLKGVKAGDLIKVRTADRLYTYQVSQIEIVESSDARLLAQTADAVVTLVTCYPFYFVGHAPQRFVVRGVLLSTQGRET